MCAVNCCLLKATGQDIWSGCENLFVFPILIGGNKLLTATSRDDLLKEKLKQRRALSANT